MTGSDIAIRFEVLKMNKEKPFSESWDPPGIPSGVPGGFFVYNALDDQELLFADRNVIELFGCGSMEEFRAYTGNSFRGMVHPEDLSHVENAILVQTFNTNRRHDYVRYRIVPKEGPCRYVEDFGHLVYGRDGRVYYYVFIIDVEKTEFENPDQNSFAETQIFLQNHKVDRLTGLLNMEAFREQSGYPTGDGGAKDDTPSSVIVFDILGLREINRSLGHIEGDARIRSLAETIRKFMPEESQLFRGHEADLIVLCRHRSERSLMDNIVSVLHSSISPILFGIGSTLSDSRTDAPEKTILHALEEAQEDLRIKKMLNAKSNQSQALTSLNQALEEADEDTEAHVQRTQKMGIALGRRVGLSDSQLSLLQLLCLLHDIGKIGIPMEILNKPGRLTSEEWAVLRSHAEKGFKIASSTDELKPLADMILHHHERWDGDGYPAGLSGDDIPVLSRIISIVDAYDAMVNDRCYRAAMSPEVAKQEIRENAGSQFDPYLAREFLSLLEENPTLALGSKTGAGNIRVFDHSVSSGGGCGLTRSVAYTEYKLNLEDVIIEVDDFFESLTGYSREEVIGKLTQYDLIPDSERAFYIDQVKREFARGDVAFLRHPIRRRDGKIIQVFCNGKRYFDSSVRAFRSTIRVFEIT